jgi:hypothetical protein
MAYCGRQTSRLLVDSDIKYQHQRLADFACAGTDRLAWEVARFTQCSAAGWATARRLPSWTVNIAIEDRDPMSSTIRIVV